MLFELIKRCKNYDGTYASLNVSKTQEAVMEIQARANRRTMEERLARFQKEKRR